MILTQQLIEKQVKKLGLKEIKLILNRKQLRFSLEKISTYCYLMFLHQDRQKCFSDLYKEQQDIIKEQLNQISYPALMKNLALMAKLWSKLFKYFNHEFSIKASSLYNAMDTTQITVKMEKSITQKDWDSDLVTSRYEERIDENKKKINVKVFYCGYKGLAFMNRKKQIYFAGLSSINASDQNILKQTLLWYARNCLKGFLLADRGCSNKEIRKRFDILRSDQNLNFKCKILSPFHYTQQKKGKHLNTKERKLYKKRWDIELVFKTLKGDFQSICLNLSGVKNYFLREAKFFIALTKYNLSTI